MHRACVKLCLIQIDFVTQFLDLHHVHLALWAFCIGVGGDELRARLQDYLTIRLINELVDCSYDSSHVDPRRKGELAGKMKTEVLEVVNDAEMEFAECKTWLKTPSALDLGESHLILVPDDTDVVGKLAKRIAEDTNQADSEHLRQLIWSANIIACNDLQIIQQVGAAIKFIKI